VSGSGICWDQTCAAGACGQRMKKTRDRDPCSAPYQKSYGLPFVLQGASFGRDGLQKNFSTAKGGTADGGGCLNLQAG